MEFLVESFQPPHFHKFILSFTAFLFALVLALLRLGQVHPIDTLSCGPLCQCLLSIGIHFFLVESVRCLLFLQPLLKFGLSALFLDALSLCKVLEAICRYLSTAEHTHVVIVELLVTPVLLLDSVSLFLLALEPRLFQLTDLLLLCRFLIGHLLQTRLALILDRIFPSFRALSSYLRPDNVISVKDCVIAARDRLCGIKWASTVPNHVQIVLIQNDRLIGFGHALCDLRFGCKQRGIGVRHGDNNCYGEFVIYVL
eukprot:XP_001706209.1 Hypothetical protein GL50803_20613 [Giardia lamblia ATCC 50803]